MKTKEKVLSELSGIPEYRITADDKGEYITKSGALKAMEVFANQTPTVKEVYEVLNTEIQRLEEEHRKNGIEFCDDDEMLDYDLLRALRNQQKGLEKAMELIIKLEISKNMVHTLKGIASTREVYLDGKYLDPARSQKARNHSPNGFSWGYSGSGPAQLALAIMLELTGKSDGYQDFKFRFIAGLPQGKDFDVTFTDIDLIQ